ncbi:MAG: trehalose-phosphatase [Zhengella sp.]|uniref:trehalose-phosphatase n=1 Tax=Zhengella sp. TaxID=2282762 RepID=UPI0035277DC2|nr:trehalose-phosphatase [Brucellaceae bacterium]
MDSESLPAPPDDLAARQAAFFLDFDGTLARIVENPADARIDAGVLADLRILHGCANGALAIISGREIRDIDRRLGSFRPPVAGVHGLEWRLGDGVLRRAETQALALEAVRGAADALSARHDGLVIETKQGSLSLHYRKRPDLAAACLALAREVRATSAAIHVIEGKMVVEFKASARTKGDALADFMAKPPFAGRLPVFAGDDTTDEAAFERIEDWNGIAIKVGAGVTRARYRLADPDALHRWLARIAARASDMANPS